jgi:hypothetical protein
MPHAPHDFADAMGGIAEANAAGRGFMSWSADSVTRIPRVITTSPVIVAVARTSATAAQEWRPRPSRRRGEHQTVLSKRVKARSCGVIGNESCGGECAYCGSRSPTSSPAAVSS